MKKQLLNLNATILLFFSATITNAQSWPYVVSSGTGINTGGGNGVSGRDLYVVSDQEIYTAMHASSSDQIEIYKYDCLKYHDKSLHSIVIQLINNEILFEKNGGFFIEVDGVFAESMLGFIDKKIVISPISKTDSEIFTKNGYKIIDPIEFNIKDLQ